MDYSLRSLKPDANILRRNLLKQAASVTTHTGAINVNLLKRYKLDN